MKPSAISDMPVPVTPGPSRFAWITDHIDFVDGLRIAVFAALAIGAVLTPGFLSFPSLLSLLTTLSFVGCVAVGMTMITLSGHIMSFSLGATAAAAAVAFVYVLNAGGLAAGVAAALVTGASISAAQGIIIGSLRANPIIVSIASLALIYGILNLLTGNATLDVDSGSVLAPAWRRPFGIPIEAVAFLLCLAIGQFLLSFTIFGRRVFLIGSGMRSADVLGLRVWRSVTAVYAWAGMFAAMAGILLATRYNQANMEYGIGYDYDAIAAVLVGGVAIKGGVGSMWRTLAGVCLMATVQVVLLLHGFRQEWQYLIAGLIVLLVVVLQSRRRS
jgi:ribose/xylose/arabinose/galactoside ABC-type transport system permease subunit